MGTVDAHAIHPAFEQLPHQQEVFRGFGRQGDHDVCAPFSWLLAQQGDGILLKMGCAFKKGFVYSGQAGRGLFLPAQHAKVVQHRIEGGQHMRLSPPDRGQAKVSQLVLQRPQIPASQRQVMQKVLCTGLTPGRQFQHPGAALLRLLFNVQTQGFQLPYQVLKGIGRWRFVRCIAHACKLPPSL